jgi:hypothetical protein
MLKKTKVFFKKHVDEHNLEEMRTGLPTLTNTEIPKDTEH